VWSNLTDWPPASGLSVTRDSWCDTDLDHDFGRASGECRGSCDEPLLPRFLVAFTGVNRLTGELSATWSDGC
jgi:hypothetical protein